MGAAHFTQSKINIPLGQSAATGELIEYAGELFGKALEHRLLRYNPSPARTTPFKTAVQSQTRPGAHRAAGR